MNGIFSKLRTVAEDLNGLGANWALIGALAVSVHSEPRTTRDIDVAVVIPEAEKERLFIQQLLALGYGNETVLMHLSPTHRLGVRLQIRGTGDVLPLDLLFSSSGIESEIVAYAEQIEVFPGLLIPVACRGHLIAMKVLSQNDSDRLRDRDDLRRLLAAAQSEDIQIASDALSLMAKRGFQRNKDLKVEFEQALKAAKGI